MAEFVVLINVIVITKRLVCHSGLWMDNQKSLVSAKIMSDTRKNNLDEIRTCESPGHILI